MIPLTPLFSQYRDSFFLYAFRHMNRIRIENSKQLANILSSELTYLYNIACLITYKDVQPVEVEEIKKWTLSLDKSFDVERMRILFNHKMEELNLRAPQPKNYSYTFTTIWDTIHFMALLADDMVNNREKLTYDVVAFHLKQIKVFFYNLFLKLDCAICRDHYINIKGNLIFYVERIETCLHREKYGEDVVWVDEITPSNASKNVLMKHGMLYTTMVFHNHVNDYKWIQRNTKPPKNTERMEWSKYKELLELK